MAVTQRAKQKKIEEEDGGKMKRYGVCLILERGEVSLPEGLLGGGCVFFPPPACQSCGPATCTAVFLVTRGLQ